MPKLKNNVRQVDEEYCQRFIEATYDYIQRYGGHVWAFEQIQNIDEGTRQDFIKAITTLSGFAQNLLKKVSKLEGGEYCESD